MNTNNTTQEQISAFADGEAMDSHTEIVLSALRLEEGRATWDAYHHIGDVLRSSDLAFVLRPDFAARMAQRLDAEPTIFVPALSQGKSEQMPNTASAHRRTSRKLLKRFVIPGTAIVAALAATVGLITAPQLMVAVKGSDRDINLATKFAAANSATALATSSGPNVASARALNSSVVAAGYTRAAQDGVMLRDPRINDYLMAHQRFSPSVYSTAQYAHPVTFSTDSNK